MDGGEGGWNAGPHIYIYIWYNYYFFICTVSCWSSLYGTVFAKVQKTHQAFCRTDVLYVPWKPQEKESGQSAPKDPAAVREKRVGNRLSLCWWWVALISQGVHFLHSRSFKMTEHIGSWTLKVWWTRSQKHRIVHEMNEGRQNCCLHQKEWPFLINSSPVMEIMSLQPYAVLLVLQETDLRNH